MTEPNTEVPSDTPTITLAGKDWPIPKLAPKQNRIVVPGLLKFYKEVPAAGTGAAVSSLTTEQYDNILTVVYTALTRANKIPRLEFDDLEIDTLELFNSLRVIGKQSGLLKDVPADAKPGESEAENPQTGTN